MVTTTRKKRIARAVAVWIKVAKSQLVKDAGESRIAVTVVNTHLAPFLPLSPSLSLLSPSSVPGSTEGATRWTGGRLSDGRV